MAKAAGSKKPITPKKPTTLQGSRARTFERRPTEEDIRKRAYEIYLHRGRAHGHDLDDWFVAERELDLVEMK